MGQEYTGELVYVQVENVFDNWGRLLDLPRIPQEDPAAYKTRLLDVFPHRAGPQHLGLVFGLNRELGLTVYDPALVIKPYYLGNGQPSVIDLSMNIQADGVHILTSRFERVREQHTIDRDNLRVELQKQSIQLSPTVEYKSVRVDRRVYEVDEDRNELVFPHEYAGRDIKVTYIYEEIVPITGTMQSVVDGINGLMMPGDQSPVARAFLANNLPGSASAEGLAMMPTESVFGLHESNTGDYYNELYAVWGQASIRSLSDDHYIDANLNDDGTYYGTILMRLVEASRRIARVTWGQTLFDRDRFSDIMGLAEIPTLTDAKAGVWRCSDPNHAREYGAEHAAGLFMKCPRCSRPLSFHGVHPLQLKSGVGGEDDLKVIVEDGEYSGIEPTIYDAVAVLNGEFVTPETATETDMEDKGY